MSTIVKLATSNERKPVKACDECRHFKHDSFGTYYHECGALSRKAYYARQKACANGEYWEPLPPQLGILVRFKRWLVG